MKKTGVIFMLVLWMALVLIACDKENEAPPVLNISERIVVPEGTGTPEKVIFTLSLNASATEEVSVVWSTLDGTAKAGEDYVEQTDVTTIFQQGEAQKTEEIELLEDDVFEQDKEFSIIITNVKNASLGNGTCKVTIENDDDFIPDLLIEPRYFVEEGAAGRTLFKIPVRLSGPSESDVQFIWATAEGWAKYGQDFMAVEPSQVVMAPGTTEYELEVMILDDDIFEMDDFFDIHITNIQGTSITDTSTRVYINNDDDYQPELVADGAITPDSWPGMTLVWSDEFEGSAINTDNWGYDLGGGGWGNNEWQVYTSASENSFLSDGKLNIRATKLYSNYYSARLLTKGKEEFTYGRIDIRARMPYGKGIWPALWMLGANFQQVGWPRCGEIDIMEYLGHIQSQVHGTLHYYESGHTYKTGTYTLPGNQSFHDAFHVFTIVWQENTIKWYVDYQPFHQLTDTQVAFGAFRLPQFFICNVAVGGNWPGYPDDTTVFPQIMEIDYIRVFQVD